MKAAIFGGTFDPIHFGHLITAQSVLLQRKLDKIIFMPCFISPHKTNSVPSSPFHRINMLKLAIEDYDKFSFSDYEIEKKKISYTIDTIKSLKSEYGDLELIIGFDSLLNFEEWKNPDEIVDLVTLVVMKRSSAVNNINRFFKNAVFLETPVIDISSTDIRAKRKNNIPIDFLVPEKVLKYIRENDLYK